MKNPPFCQWFHGDWIRDTRTLTITERGAWIDLLAWVWIKGDCGKLSISLHEVAQLWGVSEKVAAGIIRSFQDKHIGEMKLDPNANLTLTSRRIERDQNKYKSNTSRQRRYYERHEKRKPNANLTPKKPEVRSQKTDKENNKDTLAATAPSAAISVSVSVNKPPHVDFVERFKASYQSMTGQPFKDDKHHYILAAGLIKRHGPEQCVAKAKMLGVMCKNKSTWFTKDGWGDFSIERLSKHWNSIIPGTTLTEDEKSQQSFEEERRKWREHNERVDAIIKRS